MESADLDRTAPLPGSPDPGTPPTPSSLTRLEVLAVQALVRGDVDALLQEVDLLAKRLSGPEAAATRAQLLSRELAAAHALVAVLGALASTLAAKKDDRGALLASRLLDAAVRRVAVLAAAHAGQGRARPVVVAVAHADQVAIAPGGLP